MNDRVTVAIPLAEVRGKMKSRATPKGRQVDLQARADIAALLAGREVRRDLLIEFLHLVQDKYGDLAFGQTGSRRAKPANNYGYANHLVPIGQQVVATADGQDVFCDAPTPSGVSISVKVDWNKVSVPAQAHYQGTLIKNGGPGHR